MDNIKKDKRVSLPLPVLIGSGALIILAFLSKGVSAEPQPKVPEKLVFQEISWI